MDSKIIAAIIIAVGFVAGIYLYTQNTPFNRCISAMKAVGNDYETAAALCIRSDMDKF
jgi:hypothetical protein